MEREEAIAICYSIWRKSKGEIAQTSMKQQHDLLLFKYMKKLVYGKGAANVIHTESFEWVPQIKAELPNGARIYKVKTLRTGFTYHKDAAGHKYKRNFSDEELKRSARTMIGVSVNLDHFQIPKYLVQVIDAEFNAKEHDVEALVYCVDDFVNKLYDNGRIIGSSVEYGWRDEKCIDEECSALDQIGVKYTGLALCTDRFDDSPASPYTSVERYLTMNAHSLNVKSEQKENVTKMNPEELKRIEAIEKKLLKCDAGIKAVEMRLGHQGVADAFAKQFKALGFDQKKIDDLTKLLKTDETDVLLGLRADLDVLKLCASDRVKAENVLGRRLTDLELANLLGTSDVEIAIAAFNMKEQLQVPEMRAKLCAFVRNATTDTRTPEEHAVEHFKIETEAWNKLTDDEKREHIEKLPKPEKLPANVEAFLACTDNTEIFAKLEAVAKQLQESPLTVEQIKAKIAEIATARAKIEELLYPDSPDPPENEVELRAQMNVLWAEQMAYEEALENLIAGATQKPKSATGEKTHKETVGGIQHGITSKGDDTEEVEPTAKLKEHWTKEEAKRKRFERSPLNVT